MRGVEVANILRLRLEPDSASPQRPPEAKRFRSSSLQELQRAPVSSSRAKTIDQLSSPSRHRSVQDMDHIVQPPKSQPLRRQLPSQEPASPTQDLLLPFTGKEVTSPRTRRGSHCEPITRLISPTCNYRQAHLRIEPNDLHDIVQPQSVRGLVPEFAVPHAHLRGVS